MSVEQESSQRYSRRETPRMSKLVGLIPRKPKAFSPMKIERGDVRSLRPCGRHLLRQGRKLNILRLKYQTSLRCEWMPWTWAWRREVEEEDEKNMELEMCAYDLHNLQYDLNATNGVLCISALKLCISSHAWQKK